MKKLTKIMAVVLAIALCSCLFACGGGTSDTKGTIAVVAKGETHAFWQGLAAQIDDYLDKYTLAQLLLSSSLPEKNDTYKKGDIL